MFRLLFAGAIVFLLVVTAEYLWRVKKHHTELTRKFVHITVGSFVASWPWFLSWRQIELMSLVFLVGVIAARSITILTRVFSVFGSVRLIGRKTMGELFFSLGIGATALMTHDPWIFAAAMLHVSLADGLAAIIGTHYGRRTRYKVLGQAKTLVGSLTFFAVSIGILMVYQLYGQTPVGFETILVALALAATIIENVAVRGLDNLLVPLLIVWALTALKPIGL